MSVTLEGSHICHAVKMALHISEMAVLESIFTEHWEDSGDTITKRLHEWKGRSSGPLDFL